MGMRILRGVNSVLSPCGCLIGLYETYSGQTIAVIDARGSECPDASHRLGAVIPVPRKNEELPTT